MAVKIWQLQNAKNRFSELVECAVKGEPQLVTKNNKPAVYIIGAAAYEKKFRPEKSRKKSILLARPHRDILLNLSRDRDSGREDPL